MAGCTAGRCRRIDGGVALDEGVSGAPTPVASIGEGFRGSSYARRGVGLGTTTNPGTRASGEARPTGLFSAPRNPLSRSSVGRATLDAASAWVPRGIQERGRRAKPDPRGLFSALTNQVARAVRGSSYARRGDGLGTTTNPGTQASGEARPTGVSFSATESIGEDFRGSSYARRGVGLGTTTNPGTRASGEARPTIPYAATAPPSRRRMISSASPMIRSISSLTLGTSWMSPATMPQLHAPASISPCCITRG